MRNSYLFIYFTGTLFFINIFSYFFVTVFVMCIGALEILYVLYYNQINKVTARLLWLVLKLLAMFSQWKDKVLIQPLKLQWQIPITLSVCLLPAGEFAAVVSRWLQGIPELRPRQETPVKTVFVYGSPLQTL